MKVKRLKKGEYRVIQIDRDAIFEVLREFIIDHQEQFFDVLSYKDLELHFGIDQNDVFTCIAFNSNYRAEFDKLDVDEIYKTVGITAKSLWIGKKRRYKTIWDPVINTPKDSL